MFHLLAPYAVQLGLAFLLLHQLPVEVLWLMLVFGGWIAMLFCLVFSIPFGGLHVYQTIRLAPGWPSRWTQFLAGLLNPSLAVLTIFALFYFAPELMSGLWK